ncbi:hypothetical protein LEN26_003141 [Aphanomyces euteiches]|nr:hypothetical protein AeMF1_007270 [Aphanomyces euteiches]KAH9157954.1 hypothetical protein LEN26_003141 [Aphanomyces euteiches]KAH9179418.1 hypothetical protein AeNC1_017314 [Aphanomyces euteiches]
MHPPYGEAAIGHVCRQHFALFFQHPVWTSFGDRDLALPAVAATSSALLGWLLLRHAWKVYQLSAIPQPKSSSFLFGNLLDSYGQVAQWHETGSYPEPFLGWVKEYGNAVRMREFFDYTIMVADPKAVQHLFSTNASNYHRTSVVEDYLADFTFGHGLLSTRGAVHDAYRKMLNQLFSAAQVKKFVPIYEAQARHACETVLAPAAASGEVLNLYTVFSDLTLRVIGLAGFGFNFEDHPEAHAAYQMVQQEMSPIILIGLATIPGFVKLPLPSFQRRRRAQVVLRRVVNEVIEKKLAEKVNEDKPKDLLDLILPHSTTREAIIHTMTFLSAGHETSSSSLTIIFASISSRPDVIQRIRQEYKDVMAKHGSLTTWEAVKSMRLHVVVLALARRLGVKDDYLPMDGRDPIFIPAGTMVEVNVAALNRHPKYWDKPDSFIPERFLEGTPEWDVDLKLRDGKPHAFYYVPFSIGSANCIGQRFALAEIQVILAMVVGQFDFKVAPGSNLNQRHHGATMATAKVEVTLQKVQA